MEVTKEERNQLILLMVMRIKYFGSCHDVSIDLIQNGADPRLVVLCEDAAKTFHKNNPNFMPLTFK